MSRSKIKLLLNAEPFGFGPSAAIASFFPYLRKNFEHIGYVGKKHTLDLQKHLPYDAIYDISDVQSPELGNIFSQYDLFYTALDFEMVALAQSAGLKTIIYDPLTWYWKVIPESVRKSDFYLAQDFFGVRERLEKELALFPPDCKVIPPIIESQQKISSKYILLNLGGLQNPFWPVDTVVAYAKFLIKAVKTALPESENLIIATSQSIADKLTDPQVKSYSRTQISNIMKNSRYALMTPGLGNICDAAAFNLPTIWLPPANDSQGQQLVLLEKNQMSDASLDWNKLGQTINYFDDQIVVLDKLKNIFDQGSSLDLLKEKIQENIALVSSKEESSTSRLVSQFGQGGAKKVAEFVYNFAIKTEGENG